MPYQEGTLDHTKISADLTDYVVYFDLSDFDKAGSDIFDTCQTDGGDIRAYKSDGTTQLAREVVSIDTTAKTGEVHVKFDGTLSSTSDTNIQIHYDGTSTEPAASSTYGSEAVWSDYAARYALEGDASDSTSNNRDGTVTGATFVSSAIGEGASFDGASDYIDLDEVTTGTVDDLTISLRAKYTDSSTLMMLLNEINGGNPRLRVYLNNLGDLQLLQRDASNNRLDCHISNSGLYDGNPHKITFTSDFSAQTSDFYVDGVSETTTYVNQTGTVDMSSLELVLGGDVDNTRRWFDGEVDEVRIKIGSVSADRETTEYNNQNSPSTFYSTSAEQSGSQDITETVTDTVSITESVDQATESSLDETLSISETDTHDGTETKSDTVTTAEDTQEDLASSLDETITIVEIVTEQYDVQETVQDTVTITEVTQQDVTASPDDTVSISELLDDEISDTDIESETLNITENVSSHVEEVVSDSVSVTESVEDIIGYEETVSDQVTLTESVDQSVTESRSDTARISDDTDQAIESDLDETLSLSEQVTGDTDTDLSETVSLTEDVDEERSSRNVEETVSDTVSISEDINLMYVLVGLTLELETDDYTQSVSTEDYTATVDGDTYTVTATT